MKGLRFREIKKKDEKVKEFIASLTVELNTWGTGQLKESQYAIGAFLEGELIGLVHLRFTGSIGVVVKREYWNQGIGKLLLKEIEDLAQRNKFPEIRATVKRGNFRSLAAFIKSGWKVIGFFKKEMYDLRKEILDEIRIKCIYNDDRGRIYAFTLNNQEYIVLETFKKYSRGGDYHESVQHDIVLKGKIKWEETFPGGGKSSTILKEGECHTVAPGIPHMITALEDCIVLEWLEGKFEKKYWKPYRDIIRRQLK